jgi:hypothetical protein
MTSGAKTARTLVIACGALANEITALKRLNQWEHLTIECLPASLHNRPEHIAPRVKEKIIAARKTYHTIFVAYADCGTGGLLDKALEGEDIARLPGAHCYEFFWGSKAFLERLDAEPGVFYLTDFLAQHFERLIMEDLGIRKHPELLKLYFGNYTSLVFLSQSPSESTMQMAKDAATTLGLKFEHVHTGYGALETGLNSLVPAATV